VVASPVAHEAGTDQIGGGVEHAVETIAHRSQLGAEQADGVRFGRFGAGAGPPHDPIATLGSAERRTRFVLDRRGPELEHRHRLFQKAQRHVVVMGAAGTRLISPACRDHQNLGLTSSAPCG